MFIPIFTHARTVLRYVYMKQRPAEEGKRFSYLVRNGKKGQKINDAFHHSTPVKKGDEPFARITICGPSAFPPLTASIDRRRQLHTRPIYHAG